MECELHRMDNSTRLRPCAVSLKQQWVASRAAPSHHLSACLPGEQLCWPAVSPACWLTPAAYLPHTWYWGLQTVVPHVLLTFQQQLFSHFPFNYDYELRKSAQSVGVVSYSGTFPLFIGAQLESVSFNIHPCFIISFLNHLHSFWLWSFMTTCKKGILLLFFAFSWCRFISIN